jgi:hypothetical protein
LDTWSGVSGQDRKRAVYHAEDIPSEKSEGSALQLLTPRGEKERRSKNLTPRGVKERGMGEGGDDCRRELEKVPRLSKDLEKREARGEHRRLSTELERQVPIYIHVYIHTHTHTHICMYVCMYVHTYVCMYVYTYVCMYVYMHK